MNLSDQNNLGTTGPPGPQKARGAQQDVHGTAEVALIWGARLGSGTENGQALPGLIAGVHQVVPQLLRFLVFLPNRMDIG